jgi:hypothetical protein
MKNNAGAVIEDTEITEIKKFMFRFQKVSQLSKLRIRLKKPHDQATLSFCVLGGEFCKRVFNKFNSAFSIFF